MRILIVAVGTVKDRAMRSVLDDYYARLRRHVNFEEIELADGPEAKLTERFEKATKGANIVALDVAGKPLSSPLFASNVERLGSTGKGIVAFEIGGADGLPSSRLARADARWSLSQLTFPHRLARLVLAEQLYRAMTILRNEPYAH